MKRAAAYLIYGLWIGAGVAFISTAAVTCWLGMDNDGRKALVFVVGLAVFAGIAVKGLVWAGETLARSAQEKGHDGS